MLNIFPIDEGLFPYLYGQSFIEPGYLRIDLSELSSFLKPVKTTLNYTESTAINLGTALVNIHYQAGLKQIPVDQRGQCINLASTELGIFSGLNSGNRS